MDFRPLTPACELPAVNEYRGNTFMELTQAVNAGKTQYVLRANQMRQVIEAFNAVTEAKNELVRENWRLVERVKELGG